MSDAVTATLAPYFKHHFGQTIAESALLARDSSTSAARTAPATSSRTRSSAASTPPGKPIRSSRSASPGKAFYDAQQADYEISPTFRYDQANVELGYAVSRSIRLLATGGYESDLITDSPTGVSMKPSMEVDSSWTLGQQHRLRAVAGHSLSTVTRMNSPTTTTAAC